VRGHLLGERASVVRSTVTTAAIRGFVDGAKVAVGSALAKLERNVVSAHGMIIERLMTWSTIAKHRETCGRNTSKHPWHTRRWIFCSRIGLTSSALHESGPIIIL